MEKVNIKNSHSSVEPYENIHATEEWAEFTEKQWRDIMGNNWSTAKTQRNGGNFTLEEVAKFWKERPSNSFELSNDQSDQWIKQNKLFENLK